MTYVSYVPKSYAEWMFIIRTELETSKKFEIHCWNEEYEAIANALKFGDSIECDWSYGKVIKGDVTAAFRTYILNAKEPLNKDIYDKKTQFFSIFLDNGFSSEHYGTELNKP